MNATLAQTCKYAGCSWPQFPRCSWCVKHIGTPKAEKDRAFQAMEAVYTRAFVRTLVKAVASVPITVTGKGFRIPSTTKDS